MCAFVAFVIISALLNDGLSYEALLFVAAAPLFVVATMWVPVAFDGSHAARVLADVFQRATD